MNEFERPQPEPFTWAPSYNPASSMGLNMGGVGGIMAPLMTQYLQGFAGPTNFLPHQMPGINIADQFMMREYQNNSLRNLYATNRSGQRRVSEGFLGMRAAVTRAPATQLNREQADSFAALANDPYLKSMLGAVVGPETLEGLMFGRAGDPAALASAANRIGYYRKDPATGAENMGEQSLEEFSKGLYANLYQPTVDVDQITAQARATMPDVAARGQAALKQAARAEHQEVVADNVVAKRMAGLDVDKISQMYSSYKPTGTATTIEEKTQELVKFERAVKEAGVLKENETTIGGLEQRARKMPVNEMHGFMAGQTAQVAENLFQRGMLPQSIGALSAAERVKVLANQDLDDETLTRLAREFGSRDLRMNKKDEAFIKAFSEGDTVKQEEILDRHTEEYKSRLSSSLKKIKDRTNNDPRRVSAGEAEELLGLEGVSTMASNVDARRAGDVIKKHTGALAAIREIFGDSGNTNAPVPALMAALEHLSQGATAQIGASKVESVLREMRGTAKSLGIGFTQLAGFSAQMGAYGDTLGLSAPVKMGAVNDALTMLKVMDNRGSFSGERFGGMNKQEAMQHVGMLAARGEASTNARSINALVRAYEADPKKYAGSELEAVVQQLKDPSSTGDYEVKDATGKVIKSGNIYTALATNGYSAARDVATASGMDARQFSSLQADVEGSQEYAPGGGALKTMRTEYLRAIGNLTISGRFNSGLSGIQDPDNKLVENTKEAGETRTALQDRMAAMILDSSKMKEKDQIEFITKNIESEFTDTLIKQAEARGETITPDVRENAKKQAGIAVSGMLGQKPEERAGNLQAMLADFNTFSRQKTGKNTFSTFQMFGGDAVQQFAQAQQASREAAARRKEAGLDFSGTPLQNLSDYFAEIGRTGEAFDIGRAAKEVFNITGSAEIRDRFVKELAPAFQAVHEQTSQATVTEQYFKDLKAGKKFDADGRVVLDAAGNSVVTEESKKENAATLRKLAERRLKDTGVSEEDIKKFNDKQLVAEEDLAGRRVKKLQAVDAAAVDTLYAEKRKGGNAKTKEDKIAELVSETDLTEVEGLRDAELVSEKEITQKEVDRLAAENIGKARGTTDAEIADNTKQIQYANARERALYARTTADVRAGMESSINKFSGEKIAGKELGDLIDASLKSKTVGEDTNAHDDAFLQQVDKLVATNVITDKDAFLKEVAEGRQAAKIKLSGFTGMSPENVGPGNQVPTPPGAQQAATPQAPQQAPQQTAPPQAPQPAQQTTAPQPPPVTQAGPQPVAPPPVSPPQLPLPSLPANLKLLGDAFDRIEQQRLKDLQSGPALPPDEEKKEQTSPDKTVEQQQEHGPTLPPRDAVKAGLPEGYVNVNAVKDTPMPDAPARRKISGNREDPTAGPTVPVMPPLNQLQAAAVPQESPAAAGSEARNADAPALASDLSNLTAAIKALDDTFKKLVPDSKATDARQASDVKTSNAATQVAQVGRESPRITANTSAPVSNKQSDEAMTVRGTLTLTNLQSAILAVKGSPVVNPAGGGPAVIPTSTPAALA